MSVLDIVKTMDLTPEEQSFIDGADSNHYAAFLNKTRVICDIYTIKRFEIISNKILESNNKLSLSNEEYAKRMINLTRALVFVGVVQAIVFIAQIIVPIFINK